VLYTVRRGWLVDLWHALPFRQLPSIVICTAVVLRDLYQKRASLVTYSVHTLKKNSTQKYLLHKSQKDNAHLKTTNHNRMHRVGPVYPLDFTCVYLPLSELLLHKEQNCRCY